jgi:hypothetical protein
MAKFVYKPNWYPYSSKINAKNYDDAWDKIVKMFPEYDVKKCITLIKW